MLRTFQMTLVNEADLIEQICYLLFIYCDEYEQARHKVLAAS